MHSENKGTVRRQNAAIAMHEGELRTLDLTGIGPAAQLVHRFHRVKHATGSARMGIRQQAAMRVAGQATIQAEFATRGCGSGLTTLEEANRLEFDQQRDRE
jgi:hypothetical protein